MIYTNAWVSITIIYVYHDFTSVHNVHVMSPWLVLQAHPAALWGCNVELFDACGASTCDTTVFASHHCEQREVPVVSHKVSLRMAVTNQMLVRLWVIADVFKACCIQ